MTKIVSLNLLLHVIEHDDAGDEVDNLAGRQQM